MQNILTTGNIIEDKEPQQFFLPSPNVPIVLPISSTWFFCKVNLCPWTFLFSTTQSPYPSSRIFIHQFKNLSALFLYVSIYCLLSFIQQISSSQLTHQAPITKGNKQKGNIGFTQPLPQAAVFSNIFHEKTFYFTPSILLHLTHLLTWWNFFTWLNSLKSY